MNGIADRTEPAALAVARAAFEALGAHDWPALRQLVDPGALVALKQQAVAVAEAAAEARIEDPAGVNSLGVGSIEELRGLPPEEVFIRWMAATDTAARLGRATGVAHVIPAVRYNVLGVVIEDAQTAHAVYRAEGFIQGVHVETLRLVDPGWRLSVEGVISRALRTHFTLAARPSP